MAVNYKKTALSYWGFDQHNPPFCFNCGNFRMLDVHHIEPKGMGGKKLTSTGADINGAENLIFLCRSCHNAAHGIGKFELNKNNLRYLWNKQKSLRK